MVMSSTGKVDSKVTLEEIEAALKDNKELRIAVVKLLARDHSKDYLSQVNINAGLLSDMSTRFITSEKEWQE